jgi:hypothetical protein
MISKLAFLAGLQCERLFWTRFNARDQIPPPDARLQAIFDQGREVGAAARGLFAGGMEVAAGITDPEEVERASQLALRARRPLFEPGFTFEGAFARADILAPAGNGSWDLFEVKGVTEPKEIHFEDVAFQAYVYAGAGLRLRHCFLVYLNRDYVRHGELEPQRLFIRRDCTREVGELCRTIEDRVAAMQRAIGKSTCPEVVIGPHCDAPYTCPLRKSCWAFLPEHSVMELYRGKAKGFALLERGVTRMTEIPADYSLTESQRVQVETAKSAMPRVSKPAIWRFLRALGDPVHFLDFETFSTAIPLFDRLRPFQRVPFQFSLHIRPSPGADLVHHGYLANGAGDPRPEFMARLRGAVAGQGSVVTYNAAFEKGVLEECAEAFTEFQPWVESLESRYVDLLQPFRAFRYYHPTQRGSASMKAVLPALTGSGYENLAIRDGDTASREYMRVTYGKPEPGERDRLCRQLEEYCGMDTQGMWQIISALRDVV